jgi:hypothetical protein
MDVGKRGWRALDRKKEAAGGEGFKSDSNTTPAEFLGPPEAENPSISSDCSARELTATHPKLKIDVICGLREP